MMKRIAPSRRRAFTLTEVVVVVAIIVLLTALTVIVSQGMLRRSDADRTANVIRLLDTAMQDWEKTTARKLHWGREADPTPATYRFEIIEPTTDPDLVDPVAYDQMTELLGILRRDAAVADLLADIDERLLEQDADGNLRVIDPWETPIIAIHPGRVADNYFSDVGPFDDDGTVRTALEDVLGVCVKRQMCFVSAGPDGKFGDLHLDTAAGSLTPTQQMEVDEAADNIYSYDVEVIRP